MTDMSKLNLMIQQHILEHESRLKHIDELLERAQAGAAAVTHAPELEDAKRERDQLARELEAFKQKPAETWSGEEFGQYGPMALWDTVAKRLGKLVERLEH